MYFTIDKKFKKIKKKKIKNGMWRNKKRNKKQI